MGKMENFNTMLHNEEGYAERRYCRRKAYPCSGHWAKVMDFLLFHSVFGYSRKLFSFSDSVDKNNIMYFTLILRSTFFNLKRMK